MVLLRAVLLAFYLRDFNTLTDVACASALLYFPPVVAAWAEANKDILSESMPKKTTLQTHVFALDAGYTLLMQSYMVGQLQSVDHRCCFHLMADSSPQHGRDWFLLEIVLVNASNNLYDAVQRLWEFAKKRMASCDTSLSEVEELLQKEAEE